MPKSTINVQVIQVEFTANRLKRSDIPRLRGYLARRFPKYNLIHNHLENGKFRYGYPQIQFKVIDSIPIIIGIGEGLAIVKEVFEDVNELKIQSRRQHVWEKSITLRDEEFGLSRDYYKYHFLSPWMALKEENFETFKGLNAFEQQVFLKHILRENLKTISKGFGYQIPEVEQILVEGYFKPRLMNFKNIKMLCFTGDFTVNFLIPDYLSIGKQVARGFGTIKKKNL